MPESSARCPNRSFRFNEIAHSLSSPSSILCVYCCYLTGYDLLVAPSIHSIDLLTDRYTKQIEIIAKFLSGVYTFPQDICHVKQFTVNCCCSFMCNNSTNCVIIKHASRMQSQKIKTAVNTMCQRHRSVKFRVHLTARTASALLPVFRFALARILSISCLFEYCFERNSALIHLLLLSCVVSPDYFASSAETCNQNFRQNSYAHDLHCFRTTK